MAYTNQIRILEQKLKQLENGTDKKDLERISDVINQLRRLRRLEWEENHEVVDLGDDR
jgi:hypothetical protein